jgi:hypothetical protein
MPHVHLIRWAIGTALLWIAEPFQWFVRPVQRERARVRAELAKANVRAEWCRDLERQRTAILGIKTSAAAKPFPPAVRETLRPSG